MKAGDHVTVVTSTNTQIPNGTVGVIDAVTKVAEYDGFAVNIHKRWVKPLGRADVFETRCIFFKEDQIRLSDAQPAAAQA